VSAARHRAGGFGRSVAFRTPAPRHAAAAPNRVPAGVGAGLVILLGPIAGGLAAVAVDAYRDGSTPGPPPAPVTSRSAPPASAPREGVPHAATLRTPVLLGLLRHTRLTSYCRTTYGPDITAALSDDGWMCWPPDTGRGLIDMDAVCRWRYGDDGWAGMTDDSDPTTWRCYRDPS
jgi:hypothetical protein